MYIKNFQTFPKNLSHSSCFLLDSLEYWSNLLELGITFFF